MLTSRPPHLRIVRLIAFSSAFAFLTAWTIYGFWLQPQIFARGWTPGAQLRLLAFAVLYLAFVVAVWFFAPRRLPLFIAVLAGAASCGAVGVGAPAAVALFFLSSLVLGPALLWRTAE